MEALAAISAEVVFIIGILNAHSFTAIRCGSTALKAKSAYFALVNLAKRSGALLTDMLGPFTAFNTVFAAIAIFIYRVIVTTIFTKTANIAKLYAVFKKAIVTLRAYYATLYAVIAAAFARLAKCIAVSALGTVHIFTFNTILAPSAIGADKGALRTFPAVSAQIILIIAVTLSAFRTMQSVTFNAIFTQMAILTKIHLHKTRAAPSAMRIIMARRTGAIVTASAAHSAHPVIVMPVSAIPTLGTVFIIGKCCDREN